MAGTETANKVKHQEPAVRNVTMESIDSIKTTNCVTQTKPDSQAENTENKSLTQQEWDLKQDSSMCFSQTANITESGLSSCTTSTCSITSSTSVASCDSRKDVPQSACSSNDMMSTSVKSSYEMPLQSDDSVSSFTSQPISSISDTMQRNTVSYKDQSSQSVGFADSLTSENTFVSDKASGNVDSTSVTTPQRNSQTNTTVSLSARRSLGSSDQKKRKRRGSAWSDEQTEFLMEIWSRHAEQKDVDDINHNAPVYRLIAKAMEEHGSLKTWEQCKTRIHTLKRAYKLTRDEIKAGASNITYCRHFDKLEIIMGDNETTTPQMLADLLEARRKQNRDNTTGPVSTPQKRKSSPTDKSIKRVNTQSNDKNLAQHHQTQQADHGLTQVDTTTVDNYFHTSCQPQYDQPKEILQQTSQPQQENATPVIYLSGDLRPDPSPTLQLPNQYQPMTTTTMNCNLALGNTHEINNNDIVIKHEKLSTDSGSQSTLSTVTAQTWAVPHTTRTPQKDELEKMRLDLELRKIDMERNKLEMEERQRREERDHQYRMLQLLLFGLGQQNSAHSLSGQTAEQVVVQAQNSTNLSRALENGLVPGGPHMANEKGLSFNEI